MLTWGGQWVDTTGDAPEGHLASKLLVWLRKRKKRKGILDLLGWDQISFQNKLIFALNEESSITCIIECLSHSLMWGTYHNGQASTYIIT